MRGENDGCDPMSSSDTAGLKPAIRLFSWATMWPLMLGAKAARGRSTKTHRRSTPTKTRRR